MIVIVIIGGQILKRDDLVDYALWTAAIVVHDGREHSGGRLASLYELPWLVNSLSSFRGQRFDSLQR